MEILCCPVCKGDLELRVDVEKDEILKAVWPDTLVEETNLTRNIFALRKALGESDQNRHIVTVPGQGYRFAEDVRLEGPLRIVRWGSNGLAVSTRGLSGEIGRTYLYSGPFVQ